jgi:two-component sensor histidine kinase
MAESWQTLARSYEFQDSLGRFISFNNSRRNAVYDTRVNSIRSTLTDRSAKESTNYFLDRFLRLMDGIRPYSAQAFAVAVACVVIATLFRVFGGWTPTDLRFAVYLPAILAAGLLGGVPAAVGVTITSHLIILWAFILPYFQFKWPSHTNGVTLVIYFLSSLVTIYFAHCCRLTLHRLNQRNLANQIAAKESSHRRRNLFSLVQVVIKRSLADQPERADRIFGRLQSIFQANDLDGSTIDQSITMRSLLLREFTAYGEDRLEARGPQLRLQPETSQYLTLLFHELVTNAAKDGSLSCSDGKVCVQWRWTGGRRLALTWKESGGPIATPPNKDGFGTQLTALCINALSGTIQPNYSPGGYSYSMTLRLSK